MKSGAKLIPLSPVSGKAVPELKTLKKLPPLTAKTETKVESPKVSEPRVSMILSPTKEVSGAPSPKLPSLKPLTKPTEVVAKVVEEVVTEVPVAEVVAEVPVAEVVAEVPVAEVVTEVPVAEVVAEVSIKSPEPKSGLKPLSKLKPIEAKGSETAKPLKPLTPAKSLKPLVPAKETSKLPTKEALAKPLKPLAPAKETSKLPDKEAPAKPLKSLVPSKLPDKEAPAKPLKPLAPSKLPDKEAPAKPLKPLAPSKLSTKEAPAKPLKSLAPSKLPTKEEPVKTQTVEAPVKKPLTIKGVEGLPKKLSALKPVDSETEKVKVKAKGKVSMPLLSPKLDALKIAQEGVEPAELIPTKAAFQQETQTVSFSDLEESLSVIASPAQLPSKKKKNTPKIRIPQIKSSPVKPAQGKMKSTISGINLPSASTVIKPIPITSPSASVMSKVVSANISEQNILENIKRIDLEKLSEGKKKRNESYTVAELKTIAGSLNLTKNGNKKELEDRIKTAITKLVPSIKFE